jgi:LPS sulfotransferase NodH
MNHFDAAFRRDTNQPSITVKYYRKNSRVKKTYAILMTPRSGSTWLTHEIASYQRLSCPDEYFNPLLIHNIIEKNGSRNIGECFDIVSTNMSTAGGVFGFEITYFSLLEIEEEADLLSLMLGEKFFFYLTRKNFVAQAISLFVAQETGLFHLTNQENPEMLAQRPEISYDGEKIMSWCGHILQQEYGFQKWIAERNLHVVPIIYEEMVENIKAVIEKIADHIGEKLPAAPSQNAPKTTRMTPDYASTYESRFRSENTAWCMFWEQQRGLEECRLDQATASV